jgi:hypothetical protein
MAMKKFKMIMINHYQSHEFHYILYNTENLMKIETPMKLNIGYHVNVSLFAPPSFLKMMAKQVNMNATTKS